MKDFISLAVNIARLVLVDIQWNATCGILAIALHKNSTTNNDQNTYVLLFTRDNYHWCNKYKLQYNKTKNIIFIITIQ